MGAPPGDTSQGYAAAISDESLPTSSSSFEFPSLEPLFDESYWESACPRLGSDFLNNSHCFVQDLDYGCSNGSHALRNSSATCTPAAPSDCKLQPRVYSRSPSIAHTYTPPPSGQVVELQCLPAHQHLPNDMVAPLKFPALDADGIDHILKPCHPLHSYADMSTPHVGPFSKLLPASLSYNSYHFDADTNARWGKGKQSQDPHVEAKHQHQLPDYDLFHARPKLTSSPNSMPLPHHSTLQNSMKLQIPALDVSTSRTACGTVSDIASPACLQSIIFSPVADSDSAVMEMSSASAPGAMVTSNSSFFQTSTPPESGSMPASPTPSVNKGTRTRRSLCHDKTGGVGFMVETTSLNENDGFKWKKYGEKKIRGSIFSRSYYKCDASTRCGCSILKRVQQSDGKHVLYTYWGNHNHH